MKLIVVFLFACAVLVAQATGARTTQPDPLSSGQPYVLGPGDQVTLQAVHAEELSGRPFRIETDGTITFPLLGTLHPAGLTVEQFEARLRDELAKYVREPELTISVSQFRSEIVTFAGAFRTPGAYPLQGRHTLTEMLAIVGGLSENASRVLRISRQESNGSLPLANARLLLDGTTSVADLDTTPSENKNPADTFILKANDVVTAFAVEPIVIGGEITRAGMIPLGDHKSLPLMEVVMMSGGTTRDASRKHVKVFRQEPDSGKREEIDVNLAKIQEGKEPDFPLYPRDLVVVPRSDGRVVSRQLLAVSTGVALAAITTMMVTH